MASTQTHMPDELYVSCRPQHPPRPFCVESGKACLLQACGLSLGQTVPILKCFGEDQSEPARDLSGALVVLTPEKPNALMAIPSNYKLDVSALAPDSCVYVTQTCADASISDIIASATPIQKPLVVSGVNCDSNQPSFLVVPCDGAGGYDFTQQEIIPMSQSFSPGAAPTEKVDKENLTPFSVAGPAAAQTVDALITAALGASANTAFSIEGSDITEADVKECGSVTVATKDGRAGIVINGDTVYPVASYTWDGGIGGADTVEVLENCEVLVLACAKKDYVPAKT